MGSRPWNEAEARTVLAETLAEFRRLSYAQLVDLIGEQSVREVKGPSGAEYQLEIEPIWDDKKGGLVRVLGAIDDGTFRRAFSPLTNDFLIGPDGKFVGE